MTRDTVPRHPRESGDPCGTASRLHGDDGTRAAPRSPPNGSTCAYAVVVLLITIFIVYASLFPFEYRERPYPGGPLAYLLSSWRDWDQRSDLLSNILLYLPFGFFGTSGLPSRIPALPRALLPTIAGAALSCGIEITQFHDPTHVTSMGDVYADTIGSCLGGLAAAAAGASVRWPFVRELAAHPTASLLLVMFFGYRLYPYVPVIDLHKYWHAVRPMLLAPSLPPSELARFIITWLFIAVIIHSLYGYRRFLLLFPLLCVSELLAKVLLIDNAPTLTDVGGASMAYLVWALLLRWLPGRYTIVTLAFAGMIAAQRLQPFQFEAPPHSFGWVPFASFMHGSIGVAMQAFCEKFYEYGGLIWLLGRAGVRLTVGTGLTVALLFATSYAECWLSGRSAEITDSAMALAIGVAFALLRFAARGRGDASGPNAAAAREARHFADAVPVQGGVATEAVARRKRKYAPYVPPHLRG